MCEQCIEDAQNIDPRFIELMGEILPELEALQDKLEQPMREMLSMVTMNAETGTETTLEELPPEIRERIEQAQNKAARSIGLAFVAGWYGVLQNLNQEKDQEQAVQVAHSLVDMVGKAAVDAVSYNYYINNVGKH